jgi:hypothetical protein
VKRPHLVVGATPDNQVVVRLKDEKGRQMMLEAARTWDSLAENLKHS